ncbi:DNA ligase [Thalassotalea psychrophila]|uniref:DNA ligase n=1 Tax=Thalassotalea psychrophila TaxID=3065647 RepID=A0ABY9U024_9GAMM|nr:DNA ligase [Colwelliaceae bacterium SQ149]
MKTKHIFCLFFLISMFNSSLLSAKPKLQLAKTYHDNIDVAQYYVSEKLDGVRGHWDGEHLLSKNGNVFFAPSWFIDKFPNTPLDGELWISRGKFQQTVSTVSKNTPDDSWKNIKFMIFDIPNSPLSFEQRLEQIQHLVETSNSPYLKFIEQLSFTDNQQLQHYFDRIVAVGGEGVMLHKKVAYYQIGRTNNILKLKAFQDAEATVIGYAQGKGKFQGMLGALIVKTDSGKTFKVGTGFTTAQRKNPPAVGTIITYKYWGFTNKGIPRFASFLRVRKTL